MILIGQYDSPFVRRVGIALHLYDMAYEHRPWSVFGDAERLARYNPLRRVPTLVLDDGEVLIESAAILDHLDELAGPATALIADHGPDRRHALKVCALATGLADKAVSLFYERALHEQTSQRWTERCQMQIAAVLDLLEADRAGQAGAFWFGDRARPCRHRRRLRPAFRRRGAPDAAGLRGAAAADGARRPVRGAGGLPNRRAALLTPGLIAMGE